MEYESRIEKHKKLLFYRERLLKQFKSLKASMSRAQNQNLKLKANGSSLIIGLRSAPSNVIAKNDLYYTVNDGKFVYQSKRGDLGE